MTDPNNPSAPQPPAYQPPAYPTSNEPAYSPAPGAPVPGKTLGIVALVLAIVPVGLQLVGLILGIVALVQSRKAGRKNGVAVAAIIVSAILLVLGIIATIVAISIFATMGNDVYEACVVQGSDTVQIWGQTVACSEVR